MAQRALVPGHIRSNPGQDVASSPLLQDIRTHRNTATPHPAWICNPFRFSPLMKGILSAVHFDRDADVLDDESIRAVCIRT